MLKRELSIVTGWGNHLGTGHVQRMANLACHINNHTPLRACLVCDKKPDFLPASFDEITTDSIRPESILIIRDKRDSSVKEMEDLRAHGGLIAIDDCGPGRDMADLPVDLLPNLNYSINEKELFIYGYSFSDTIKKLGDCFIKKDIDYAIYCGLNPTRAAREKILSMIPENATCAILDGDHSLLMREKSVEPLKKPYGEILLSAKVLITHFGITLFEGRAAGCRLITVNPTDYHSRLSEKAGDDLDLVNLGVIDAIDTVHGRTVISSFLLSTLNTSINPVDIGKTIRRGLDAFLSKIDPYLIP